MQRYVLQRLAPVPIVALLVTTVVFLLVRLLPGDIVTVLTHEAPPYGGAVVAETIFNLPGLGRMLITAVDVRDYPAVQASVLVTALLRYVDAGATTLLIRGYEPYEDPMAYGRDLIPLVRQELARRARQAEVITRAEPIVIAGG
jgi:hypothetical protein